MCSDEVIDCSWCRTTGFDLRSTCCFEEDRSSMICDLSAFAEEVRSLAVGFSNIVPMARMSGKEILSLSPAILFLNEI